jgi:RNA 3'-terminal phosphate cyclase (ATP)
VWFTPGAIRGGSYKFAIGSAGSTTLVFQTVLPALLAADAPSELTISGGTHNPSAPTFDYLDRVFVPLLGRMGASIALTLHQAGFYPAGGGSFTAQISPAQLCPLHVVDAGARSGIRVIADVANLPYEIAEREVALAVAALGLEPDSPRAVAAARTVVAEGHGNAVMIEIASAHVTELFTSFGERQRLAVAVVALAVADAQAYLANGAPVGPHLADQLLLPLALAGGGAFITMPLTAHTRTNAAVIETFLPVRFVFADLGNARWRIAVA